MVVWKLIRNWTKKARSPTHRCVCRSEVLIPHEADINLSVPVDTRIQLGVMNGHTVPFLLAPQGVAPRPPSESLASPGKLLEERLSATLSIKISPPIARKSRPDKTIVACARLNLLLSRNHVSLLAERQEMINESAKSTEEEVRNQIHLGRIYLSLYRHFWTAHTPEAGRGELRIMILIKQVLQAPLIHRTSDMGTVCASMVASRRFVRPYSVSLGQQRDYRNIKTFLANSDS
ncbi:hypothetical protein PT974_09486 [Cladobotryum mycophilum]|uniref:Uncharacterized protein n=1 Tax=Cladobotryum mycophilum TaxID=491253 RepID=A0ABR0SGC2_9HYPO